jgi:cytochrome P450
MSNVIPETDFTPPQGAAMASDFIDVDLTDHAVYASSAPHVAFDTLRQLAPIAWHSEQPASDTLPVLGGKVVDGHGFWAVTSHDLVTRISRDPETFSSWLGGVSIMSFDEVGLTATRGMLLNMDPPKHSHMRRLVQPIFSSRAVQAMRQSVQEQSRKIVDAIVEREEFDFVERVSSQLPIKVLAGLLGMPDEDAHLLFEWTSGMTASEDPELGEPDKVMQIAQEMLDYGNKIADDRRKHPQDDFMSLIANGEVDGERLSDAEFAAFWNLIVVAGNETTRNSISGGLISLSESDSWRRLREHPELLPTAVEEILRYVTPVMHFRRTAVRDVNLEGQKVRAGDKVVLFYSAANRDPKVFDAPHEFRIDRMPNPHVTFGFGPHFCLGAQLARLELSTVLRDLVERFHDVRVGGDVVRVQSNFLNIVSKLPITFA